MKEIWLKMLDKASDAGDFVERVAKSGLHFLKSSVGKISLFTSTSADDTSEDLEVDESHYLLVPFRADPCGYALYSMRSLPPGVGPTNSLPKARIFHVHDQAGVRILEELLVQSRKKATLAARPDDPEFADLLEKLGEQIDKESFKITGGLLIIGGAVAFVNPVVGIGIAAKALLPSLGAKASRLGLDLAGDKLRKRSERKRDRQAEKNAVAEVKRLKPELFLNPLLQQLEEAVSTESNAHDPLIANLSLVDSFPNPRYLRVSLQALLSVYEEPLKDKQPAGSLALHQADLDWFDHLREIQSSLKAPS